MEGANESFDLQPAATVLPPELAKKYPFLHFCSTLHLPELAVQQVTRGSREQNIRHAVRLFPADDATRI